MIAKMNES